MVDAIQAAIFVVIALVVAAAAGQHRDRRGGDHIIDLCGHVNECVAGCRTCGRLNTNGFSSADDAYRVAYAHIRNRYGQIFNHLDYDEIA